MNASIAEGNNRLYRYAPTPSGFLHIGNLCNFLLTWILAKAGNGKIFLRIDDLDRARFRTVYLEDIFRKLDAMGLDYSIGPEGPDDFEKNWSQQLRLPLYNKTLQELEQQPDVYACTCSRKELEEGKRCECRFAKSIENLQPWRFRTSAISPISWDDQLCGKTIVDLHKEMPDFIVRKNGGQPSYQVASIADDLYFGVTDIVRGADLQASTGAQLFITDVLQQPDFRNIRFHHHPLMVRTSGEKLSKTAGDHLPLTTADKLHDITLKEIVIQVAGWLKTEGNPTTKEELLDAFLHR